MGETNPPGFIDAVKATLRSRKFLLAMQVLVITVVGHYAGLPSELIVAIDAAIGAVILGIAYEDGQEKRGKAQPEGVGQQMAAMLETVQAVPEAACPQCSRVIELTEDKAYCEFCGFHLGGG